MLKCTNADVVRDWSDTNPPYLEDGFAERLCQLGIDHLLIDLPSVDKEIDGGALRAHNAFFGSDDIPSLQRDHFRASLRASGASRGAWTVGHASGTFRQRCGSLSASLVCR